MQKIRISSLTDHDHLQQQQQQNIFLHSLHLSAQLNVSTSVISLTLHRFLRTGIVSLKFVLLMLMLCFFLGRLLVLYFSLVASAICYLFFLHVVFYVFLANKINK